MRILSPVFGIALGLIAPSLVSAQVRGKLPDRGVYQPPRMSDGGVVVVDPIQAREREVAAAKQKSAAKQNSEASNQGSSDSKLAALVREEVRKPKKDRPLVDVQLELEASDPTPTPESARNRTSVSARNETKIGTELAMPVRTHQSEKAKPSLQQVSHDEVLLVPPQPPADFAEPSPRPVGKLAAFALNPVGTSVHRHDATCDGCADCDTGGCDSIGCGIFGCDSCDDQCDTLGCDSMGCGKQPWYRGLFKSSQQLHRKRFFGGIEYLMMWSRGDRLPALVTTDTAADPDPSTAGQLGQDSTLILVGSDRIMNRLASGGRLTLGAWLDKQQCTSLVGRAWFGGDKSFSFDQNSDQTAILARPFFDVSDDVDPPAQNAQLISFPERASGRVHVEADMETFGADLSVRQFLYGDFGGTIDLIYGYQYMRMNESLGIASTSTSLDDDFAPVGSMLAVADSFDVSNEFHGGQIGLASNYRENCWSFNALAKVGFGSLDRRATRSGVTVTTVDDDTFTDNQGLLVRSTNRGSVSDRHFGWVPELDFSLGWHRFKGLDLTFGYHIIAMTEALQASGAIDPSLAVNLSDPPEGLQSPSAGLRYRTFYLQGIHFGLQHAY